MNEIVTPAVVGMMPRSGSQWVTSLLQDTYPDRVSARHEVVTVPWSRGIRSGRRACEIRPPAMTDRKVVCIGGDAVALLAAYAREGITPGLVYVRRDPHDVAASFERVLGLDRDLALRRWQEFDAAVMAREPDATFQVERLWSGAELPAFVRALGLEVRDWSAWMGRVVDRRTPEPSKVAT